MSDAQANNSFMKAFVPGLVVGVIVGGLATAVLVPFIAERTSTVDAAEIPIGGHQAPDRYRVAPEENTPEMPVTTEGAADPAAPGDATPAAPDESAPEPNAPEQPATTPAGQPGGGR